MTSSKGYSEGKHSWKIKWVSGNRNCNWPCIVTNPNCQGDGTKYISTSDFPGKAYYYRDNGQTLSRNVTGDWEDVKKSLITWKVGETVTILLDCDSSRVAFWNGETKLGIMSIARGESYYPGIMMEGGLARVFKLIRG